MCLAVPGKIFEILPVSGMKMCRVDFGGVFREVCMEAVPEAKPGDYLIVHAGFALNILSEEEAIATIQAIKELSAIEEEIYSEGYK